VHLWQIASYANINGGPKGYDQKKNDISGGKKPLQM